MRLNSILSWPQRCCNFSSNKPSPVELSHLWWTYNRILHFLSCFPLSGFFCLFIWIHDSIIYISILFSQSSWRSAEIIYCLLLQKRSRQRSATASQHLSLLFIGWLNVAAKFGFCEAANDHKAAAVFFYAAKLRGRQLAMKFTVGLCELLGDRSLVSAPPLKKRFWCWLANARRK